MSRFFITAFSAGWLLPLWISARLVFAFFEFELPHQLSVGVSHPYSYAAFHTAFFAFSISCLWLALTLSYWVWRLSVPARPSAPPA